MVANVWKVVVAEGDAVEEGDTLVILESMKMEIPVLAESAGTVPRSTWPRVTSSRRATSSPSSSRAARTVPLFRRGGSATRQQLRDHRDAAYRAFAQDGGTRPPPSCARALVEAGAGRAAAPARTSPAWPSIWR